MQVFRSAAPLRQEVEKLRAAGKTVGFVPTMGALHDGHLSLLRRCAADNDHSILSIFVNPTQFNNRDDLRNYPRNTDDDLQKVHSVSNLFCFIPNDQEIYGEKVEAQYFDLQGLDTKLEGAFRPGHFQGVATVVKRLLMITNPHRAYFGEKDYQQLKVIETMVRQESLPVEIIGLPIEREENGLAMSSRNLLLSESDKEKATLLYRCLQWTKNNYARYSVSEVLTEVSQRFAESDLDLEYAALCDVHSLDEIQNWDDARHVRMFLAAYCSGVRLIDNESIF